MSDRDSLLRTVAGKHLGALVTLKRDGRPQLSNVGYAYDTDAGVIRISVTDTRAKTANLRRDPRASLYVSAPDGWSYAVLEGEVTLSPVAQTPDDATVEELIALYRAVSGAEHPDWDDFRRAMVAEQRLVCRLAVTHAYGNA